MVLIENSPASKCRRACKLLHIQRVERLREREVGSPFAVSAQGDEERSKKDDRKENSPLYYFYSALRIYYRDSA